MKTFFRLFLTAISPAFLLAEEEKERCHPFVTAEVLDWKVYENGLSYAFCSSGSTTFVLEGKTKKPHFKRDFGYRLGIGTTLPREGWEIFAQGTHFHSYTHSYAYASDTAVFFPTFVNAAANTNSGYVDYAESHWRLHFGQIDAIIRRKFSFKGGLFVRPALGGRWIIARQKYDITYSGGTLFPGGEDHVYMTNKFWGMGPLAGVDGAWTFWKGLGLYGNSSIALLLGHFRIHECEDATLAPIDRLNLHDRYKLVRAVIDVALGAHWEYCFSGAFTKLELWLGWENHLYFGQNQLVRFLDSGVAGAYVSNQGDLSFSGWVLGAGFTF